MFSQEVVFTAISSILLLAGFLSGRTREEKLKNVAVALVVEALMFLVIFTSIIDRFGWLMTF